MRTNVFARYPRLIVISQPEIHDQGAIRRHFAGAWEALPETMNWKPYWGRNDDACIVHFHGPKPTHLVWMLTREAHGMPPLTERLLLQDPHAYAHYLGRWFEALAAARFAAGKKKGALSAPD